MEVGYIGVIGNRKVFIIADNIADAADKLEENCNGEHWEFFGASSVEIIK